MAGLGERIRSALIFIVVIGLFLGLSGYEILCSLREVLFFEHTTGVVTAYIAPDKNADDELEAGRLEFIYSVDGTQYEGRYPPEYWMSMPRAPYPILERAWDVGEKLDVYYALSDPAEATLAPRVEPFPFALVTFVLPFAMLGFYSIRNGNSAAVRFDTGRLSFFPLYAILSVVSAFGIMVAGRYGGWPVGVALGALLPTVGVPGCVRLLMWWSDRGSLLARARRVATRLPGGNSYNLRRKPRRRGRGGRERRRDRTLLILVAVVWCAATSTFLVPLILTFAQNLRAKGHYMETTGRVLESRLKKEGDHKVRYRPVVVYQYAVDGKVFRNDRIMFGAIDVSWSHDHAESIRNRFPESSALSVYYDPADPQQAVLSMNVANEYALPAFGVSVFAVVGVYLVVGLFFRFPEVRNARLKRALAWAFPAYFCAHVASFVFLSLAAKDQPENAVEFVWLGIGAIAATVIVAVLLALLTYTPATQNDRVR